MKKINDIDILCSAQSIRRLEFILEENGYHNFEKLTSIDINNLYSTIHVISEPRTWLKRTKVVQLIRPRIDLLKVELMSPNNKVIKITLKTIENVGFKSLWVSTKNIYMKIVSAILHCLNKQYNIKRRPDNRDSHTTLLSKCHQPCSASYFERP